MNSARNKAWDILCVVLIAATCMAVLAAMGGCGPKKTVTYRQTPKTEFAAPTTVPSVVPHVAPVAEKAAEAAKVVEQHAKTIELVEQPQVREALKRENDTLRTIITDLRARLAVLEQVARAAEAAAHRLSLEAVHARSLVLQREAQMAEDAKREAELQKMYDDLASDSVQEQNAKDRTVVRGVFVGSLVLCVVVIGVGVFFIAMLKEPKIGGAIVAGGFTMACISMGGIYYGKWYALIGLAVGGIAMLTSMTGIVWWCIAKYREAAHQIEDKWQQAKNAGKIVVDEVTDRIASQAMTSSLARRLANEATPDGVVPEGVPATAAA